MKKKSKADNVNVASGSIAGSMMSDQLTKNLQEATRRVFNDTDELQKVIEQYKHSGLAFNQGRAFEFLESMKFNREAAEAGRNDLMAHPTHFHSPHSPADIVIEKNGNIVSEVQAKSYTSIREAISEHFQKKYHGMGRLNPVEQYHDFRELLEKRLRNAPEDQLYRQQYEDVHNHQMRTLHHENIESPGTTRPEAEFAANHPELAHMAYNGEAIFKEVATGSIYGAGMSAGFTTLTKGMLSAHQVVVGKKHLAEAVSETMSMTASAAVRGAIVSATSSSIAIAARSEGLKSISQGTAPVAIANTVYEAGRAINKFINGELDKTELKEECGTAMLKGVSTYYCGLVGQVLIPVPVLGAMVGSLIGYTTSTLLVQSGILGAGPRNIVKAAYERRRYIEEQSIEAVRLMRYYKSLFEQVDYHFTRQYKTELLPTLNILEGSILSGDAVIAMHSLTYLNEIFASKLQFRNFDEFDSFMKDENSTLKL